VPGWLNLSRLAGIAVMLVMGMSALFLELLAHPPYLYDLALQWLISIAIYPMLVLVLSWLFRIGWRKPEAA